MIGLISYMLYPACAAVGVFHAFIATVFEYTGLVCLALATFFAVLSACNYIIKNKFVFAKANGTDAKELANLIINESNGTIAVAESFTGGNISASLVSVPGASKFLLEGLTCYSNQAKEKILGVNQETIRLYGAVSEQTASEMLDGLKKTFRSRLSCRYDRQCRTNGRKTKRSWRLLYRRSMRRNQKNTKIQV